MQWILSRDHSGWHVHDAHRLQREVRETLDRPVTVSWAAVFRQLAFPADARYKAPWLAWFGGAYGAVGFALAAIRSASAIGGHVHRLTSARSYQCSSIILAGSVPPSPAAGIGPFSHAR